MSWRWLAARVFQKLPGLSSRSTAAGLIDRETCEMTRNNRREAGPPLSFKLVEAALHVMDAFQAH